MPSGKATQAHTCRCSAPRTRFAPSPRGQVDAINQLGAQGNVFERLAASIAPEIYGMRDVKKVGGGVGGGWVGGWV
jgi:DNA replicative helicase MCM subunit Mcm2 (Cdc46/Mcm family)